MSKRFTDTEKYKKPFIRRLPGAYKLLWDYLYHNCDNAGIWIVDFEIAQIYLGADVPVNKSDALKHFNQDEIKVIEIDDSKWFLPSFIEFQHGVLSEKNNAHKKAIQDLLKYDLVKKGEENTYPLRTPSEPPQGGSKVMVEVKVKDKVKVKVKEKGFQNSEIIYPYDTPKFRDAWEIWKKARKEAHKSVYKPMGEQAALSKLGNISENEDEAIEIIKESIANGWKGLFELDKSKANVAGIKNITPEYIRDQAAKYR